MKLLVCRMAFDVSDCPIRDNSRLRTLLSPCCGMYVIVIGISAL
jgi:hypothetical protein